MSLYQELKRRNVFRVAIAYLAGSWLLVEVAGTIFPLFGFSDTPTRILVIVLAIGFPLFALFSWVFEITPEGLKKEKDIDRTASITHNTGKQLDRVIIVLLALALGYFAFDKFVLDPVEDAQIAESAHQEGRSEAFTESYGDKSIAVLPFVNMSSDAEQEYFSDGLSEELLNLLAKIPQLRVISRSSAFSFKGKKFDIPTIAAQLNVAHILEGSVRRAGDRVRITAQLIEARSDTHLWSETYDRNLTATDIFTVQSEIVESIVQQLEANLSPEDSRQIPSMPTKSLAAYTAFLKGRSQADVESITSLNEAVENFKEALTLDPNFALAYVGLADAYLTLSVNFYGGLTPDESNALAEPPLLRALELDQSLGQAYATLGLLKAQQGDLQAAEQAYEQAISLQPSYPRVFRLYGRLRWSQSRPEEALELFQEALALDPFSVPVNYDLGVGYNLVGRFDDALTSLLRVVEIKPNHAFAYVYIAAIHYLVYGKVDESLIWYHKAAQNDALSPSLQAAPALAYLELGDADSAKQRINRGLELGPKTFWTGWASLLLSLYMEDDTEAQNDARTLLEAYPGNWGGLLVLRNADIAAGRYEVARSRYARAYRELTEPEAPEVTVGNYKVAVDLALVLMHLGEQERANNLLEGSLEIIETLPRLGTNGYFIADVQILALQQRPQQALAMLRQAIDQGWRFMVWYHLDRDPNLDSIRHEPEFQRLYKELKTDLAEQARRVQEMKASGELSSTVMQTEVN